MALGVFGFGCEDALIHLLNYVWPNIFETSPHLVQAFMEAVEGLRVALGPIKILQYTLQVRRNFSKIFFFRFLAKKIIHEKLFKYSVINYFYIHFKCKVYV